MFSGLCSLVQTFRRHTGFPNTETTSQLYRYISPSLSHSCTALSGTQREELKQRKLAERCPDGCTTSYDEHSFSAHLFSQVRAPEQHDITFVFPPPLTCCIRGFYSVCSSSDGHSRLQTWVSPLVMMFQFQASRFHFYKPVCDYLVKVATSIFYIQAVLPTGPHTNAPRVAVLQTACTVRPNNKIPKVDPTPSRLTYSSTIP